jgi:voltage-gated sodium channel
MVKIIALGPKLYFNDGWNVFDFIIVIGSIGGIFISNHTQLKISGTTSVLRAFRIFRILRIMRLIKRAGKSITLIFNTFILTLHSLVNIGGLLLVFIFIYSILGMMIFGQQKRNGFMNDYINFENFSNAFITLFAIATIDSWNFTAKAFALENDSSTDCIENA